MIKNSNVLSFTVCDDKVFAFGKVRKKVSACGCNEPHGDRYFCPKRARLMKTACPFYYGKRECENFERMCGSL